MAKPIIKLRQTSVIDRFSTGAFLEALTAATDELRNEINFRFPGLRGQWQNDTWERFQGQMPRLNELLQPHFVHPLRNYRPTIQAATISIPVNLQSVRFKLTNFTYLNTENDSAELYYDSVELVWLETLNNQMLLALPLQGDEVAYKPFLYSLGPDQSISEYRIEE